MKTLFHIGNNQIQEMSLRNNELLEIRLPFRCNATPTFYFMDHSIIYKTTFFVCFFLI